MSPHDDGPEIPEGKSTWQIDNEGNVREVCAFAPLCNNPVLIPGNPFCFDHRTGFPPPPPRPFTEHEFEPEMPWSRSPQPQSSPSLAVSFFAWLFDLLKGLYEDAAQVIAHLFGTARVADKIEALNTEIASLRTRFYEGANREGIFK